jgi:hypothetical protein
VGRRANNPSGTTADEQADIARYVAEVEPLIRRTATHELDGLLPVTVPADHVETLLRAHRRGALGTTRTTLAARACRDVPPQGCAGQADGWMLRS